MVRCFVFFLYISYLCSYIYYSVCDSFKQTSTCRKNNAKQLLQPQAGTISLKAK